MKDRFDFEQEIMDCWGITDDIQTLIDNCEGLTEDELMNTLIGMKQLYHLKFLTMFSTFEGLIPLIDYNKFQDEVKSVQEKRK